MEARMTTLAGAMTVLATAAALAWASPAPAQQQKPADCPSPSAAVGAQAAPGAPEKIAGEVVEIDRARNMVTLRGADGQAYRFQASPETLADLEKGDRLEAQLRRAPGC